MLIPDPRIGPWLVRDDQGSTLVIPLQNGEGHDCIHMRLRPGQLAHLVAEGVKHMRDYVMLSEVRQTADFVPKSHDDGA
ncbi:MAG: hypothetical protein EA385_14075 [Salinarimonadaceae bacterium]|nr:MAG: hypothetical protein EA385_14075 [Salinarimonadaceae bacterium]